MAKIKSRLEIYGQKISMIERKCRGCNKMIKVSEKSKQKYHSWACELVNGKQKRSGVRDLD